MSVAEKRRLISVEEYLAGEMVSSVKHEYLEGVVYAMAGGRNLHNSIALNVTASLHARLRGKPCRPFNSDTKVRIRLADQIRFYYPDAMVVCRPNSLNDTYQDEPVVIFEVLSQKTRRIDEGEKKHAYLSIRSLTAYGLIEQEFARVTVFRRTKSGFEPEDYVSMDSTIALPEIDIELPLREIYEDLELTSEEGD